jgi:quercetin dioxygenase-like cupin family protein
MLVLASGLKPISMLDVPADTRRGGEIRTLLSPRTVGSTSGFMGVASVAPGDYISSHLHPYSEEFVFLVRGTLRADLGEEQVHLAAGQAILIPKETPHRLVNVGTEEAFLVFHLGPLAPAPELGHVDLEQHVPLSERS